MAKEVAYKISVDSSNAQKSLGDLEQEFEKLNEEIKQVPINSKEFNELNKQLAQTGREIKNVELGFESLDNEQVASELGSVAGAVGDVSAAFILLGDDSETLQEVAKNIELAMGLSMGLKGAIEGVSSARKLLTNSTIAQNTVEKVSNFVKGQGFVTNSAFAASEAARGTATAGATVATSASTGAMKLFRLALISTGIGAIIVGLGLLIVNFEKVTKVVKQIPIQIQKLSSSFREMSGTAQTVIGVLTFGIVPAIAYVTEALEDYGAVETESARTARLANEEKAAAAKKAAKEYQEALKAETEALKKATEAKTTEIDFEIAKRNAAGKDTSDLERDKIEMLIESTKKEIELADLRNASRLKELALIGEMNSFINDIVTTRIEEINAEKDELQKTLEGLENSLVVFDIKQTKIKRDAKKAADEEAEEQEEEHQKAITRIVAKGVEDRIKLDTSNLDTFKAQQDLRLELMQDGLKKELQLSRNAFYERLADLESQGILTGELRSKLINQQVEEEARIEREAQQEEFNKKLDNAKELTSSLTNLNDAWLEAQLAGAEGNEQRQQEIRKKAFARDKALKIAEATITGIQAVQTALASPFPFNIALAAINGAAALANITKIARTKFDGADGGGSAPSSLGNTGRATGGANVGQVTNTTTTIGEPTKVFVTEQDISNTQNKVQVNEDIATL